MTTNGGWEFWVDRGGTFTDIVALTPTGIILTHKLLSDNPRQYADAAVAGIDYLQRVHADPVTTIKAVRMGTTVATNALLERAGEPTLLLITQGLRDQLLIGYQTRPDIFALDIQLPPPLYAQVAEVPERVRADGYVEQALDEDQTRQLLEQGYGAGLRSLAIVLMHAYRFPAHEQRIAEIAAAVGFTQISTGHSVSPLIKLVPRGQTTVADAFLSPILRRYVQQVESALTELGAAKPPLAFMQSNGGLAAAAQFQGKDAILSGPAGGVVGMVRSAEADGFARVIGFDMGGTSTDVSHYAGVYERETESQIDGTRLRVPMMNIHTVAAGGGSIVRFADGRLQVGPESAGAFPGPTCYRNGGPLTVTDCNLVLGRIQPEHFPAVFGPDGNQPLDLAGTQAAFAALAAQVFEDTGQTYSVTALAAGFLEIAVSHMAAAVHKISVQRGYDVQRYILSAFGGAGGQHACAVATALGMQQVYLHPLAGVLSAYGIGIADQRWLGEGAIELPLSQAEAAIAEAVHQLQLESTVTGESLIRAYLRYEGADTPLLVSWQDARQARSAFEQQHQQLFGFAFAQRPVVVDAVQVECIAPGVAPAPATVAATVSNRQATDAAHTEDIDQSKDTGSDAQRSIHHDNSVIHYDKVSLYHDGWLSVPVVARTELAPGSERDGPLLITEANSTHVVEPGWRLSVLASGALLLRSIQAETKPKPQASEAVKDVNAACDPVRLEIFNSLFMSVAEQMGFVLEKTASSVNIKERLDFSCALFDETGALIANAPHIPVHLGSMSESVQVVRRDHPVMQPGDAFVLNTPYNGGTHLPDVTVIKPVFISGQPHPDFFVAARGHHADIGGITPGSMPANSRHIEEEGVLLDNLVLVRGGVLQEAAIRSVLTSARYPARNPDQNIADLMAQLAACEKGAAELARLCDETDIDVVKAYMGFVQDNAEDTLRACLAELPSGQFRYVMDDGTKFQVRIEVDQLERQAVVDFTGTGYRPEQPLHPGNFNAPTAVVVAAVLYTFRVLVQKPVPLNAGFLRALQIVVPPASIIAPQYPAAVVSGNVETAQALVDCLMGALQLMAGGQGTNNNFTFGNAAHQYYETLCGGAGASARAPGAAAVHTHMTNSRLTDPEILEQRFPVVLDRFHVRHRSGGGGRHPGGDGVERHIRFLEPMSANIISGHREVPPFGLNGGQPGAAGMNAVQRANGECQLLGGCAAIEMEAGDVFQIHSPGGGGWGDVEG